MTLVTWLSQDFLLLEKIIYLFIYLKIFSQAK